MVTLRALIAKLDPELRNAVEAAAGTCLSRTHYDIEIEHLLLKALDATDTDLFFALRHFGVDRSKLATEIQRALDKLKTGNARTPSLSPSLVKLLTEAWTIGSIDYGAQKVRTGHVLVALVTDEDIARRILAELPSLASVNPEALRSTFDAIVVESVESRAQMAASGGPVSPGSAGAGGAAGGAKPGGQTPFLDQYTVDLTANARAGKIDPVLGRDTEVRQVVDILTRRRQNNPILVGEAGVGKTAVVEGFARRIAEGDVPPPLQGVTLRTLDLALLQAGAGVKGEFENRLKGLIDEVKKSPIPIILFIDEAHTMIGAGGAAGQNDAANLLKPALARGELRTIAATTWSEYKKFFEKDPALSRRFQLVKIDEPSETTCMLMLRGVVPSLEKHHNVRITDSGLEAAVRLSHRYLPDRQLPDKAVSVLDTACARLALGQSSTPAAVEDARRVMQDLEVQERVLRREVAVGVNHAERLASIETLRAATATRLTEMEARWEQERALVETIRGLRQQLEAGVQSPAIDDEGAADKLRVELASKQAELDVMQGETPLVRVTVDASIVGEVIAGWTGIPVGSMMRDELGTLLELESHLGKRVIGQDHALEAIARRMRTSKAGIEDPNKPKGVFLLVGPSGVGKTETATTVSEMLYGGERNMITINMSEFQEPHTVSTLKGSPPGYVGYGEGGVLTEAVRRRPYSVVLLDEIEKAHPDVLELFFQVFDKGVMEDGEGRQIDFRNAVIILTTNAGTETIMKLTADPETMPFPAAMAAALKPELDAAFKPAFLGRTVIVPYYPIRDENLKLIVRLKLAKIARRLHEVHRVTLEYGDDLVNQVAARCTEVESGARNVDNILTNTLLPEVSTLLLTALVEGHHATAVKVSVDENGEFAYDAVTD